MDRAAKAEAEASDLRGRLGEALAENTGLRLIQAQQHKLLAERRTKEITQQELERKIDNVLGKLLQTPEVRTWALDRVPADVVNGLRNSSPATGAKDLPSPTRKPAPQPASSGVAQ